MKMPLFWHDFILESIKSLRIIGPTMERPWVQSAPEVIQEKIEIDNQQAPNFIHVENPYYYRCPWYSSSFEECGDRAIKNLESTLLYERL